MGRTALLLAGAAVAGGALWPAAARPAASYRDPLPVQSASVVQDGQELVWQVTLPRPFSPRRLAQDGRSLCLLVDPERGGRPRGEVCVVAPRRRSGLPRLVYARLTPTGAGPARPVAATVSRSSSRQLTAAFLPTSAGLSYAPFRWQVISTLRSSSCPPPSGQSECSVLFPTRPVRLRLHTPVLAGCTASGPEWVFRGPSHAREIALTFDDGPWYESPSDNTSQFLRVLERAHVVATFFEVGEHIGTYGEHGAIERRMLADGDMIGDHTWNHADVARGGTAAETQIKDAAAAIRTATHGFQPCLFRAPYGDVGSGLLSVAQSLRFSVIQWDIDPRDWSLPGTNAIYDNVVSNAHDGAIVLQHDGGGPRSQTLAALPREIATLKRQGYRFVTVTDLLGYRLVYR